MHDFSLRKGEVEEDSSVVERKRIEGKDVCRLKLLYFQNYHTYIVIFYTRLKGESEKLTPMEAAL